MKKFIATSLIGVFLLSGSSLALAAENLPSATYNDPLLNDYSKYQNPFSDTYILMLEGKAAAELYRRKITSGYPDGEFKGHKEINRAEAVKFLLQARYDQIPQASVNGLFSDVKDYQWFKDYLMLALEKGIVNGYEDKSFRAGNSINTAEFLKMMAKTFDLADNLPHSYVDVDASAWYAPLAGIASVYKLFPERETNLEPGRNLTRTEVAIALYNYFKYRNTSTASTADKDRYKKVTATPYSSHKLGPIDGKVGIDIIGNFATQATHSTFAALLEVQKEHPNDVRIIWNYYPKSIYDYTEYEAGNAAECADEQEKYWEYMTPLLAQDFSAYGKPLYLNIANNLGLNMKKFEVCLDEETYIGRIQHDKNQGKKYDISFLPTLIINGTTYAEEKTAAKLEEIVQNILNDNI